MRESTSVLLIFSFQHNSELADLIEGNNLETQKFNIAQSFFLKAHRCFHLSDTYGVMKKWSEAVALLERALEYITQSVEHFRDWGHSESEVKYHLEVNRPLNF